MTVTEGNASWVPTAIDYDASTDLPITKYAFGKVQQTFTYNADGTLLTSTDGAGDTTQFGGWTFGVPTSITFADNTSASASVDNNGWIRSITDENSATTFYGYDSMGRMTSVTYPNPDTQPWLPRSISYQILASSENGVPSGSWVARATDGNLQQSTYYDGRFNPILVEEKDVSTGIARYKRHQFDYQGRATYESYPSASYAANVGIDSTFDGLGRLIQKRVDNAGNPGPTLAAVSYLSGNARTTVDADGRATTTTYQSFDEPAYKDALQIVGEEGQTTTIARDVFGKMLTATQGGTYNGSAVSAARTYTYNSAQLLCRRDDPESGSTFYGYDNASRLSWELKGQTQAPCPMDLPAPLGATAFSYDARSRKILDDYPGTSDDVSYGYWPNGALKSVTNANAVWNYSYNKRNLLETEQAVVDGKAFDFDPEYDTAGHLASLTTPSRTISFVPDAWGRPTQANGYATAVRYHPNDLVSGYQLGNGLLYSQSVDYRLRPSGQVTTNIASGAVIQKYAYTLSDAGDVEAIDDQGPDNTDDATLGYDHLHRLQTATGMWGAYTYEYDPLNNIRKRLSASGSANLAYGYNASTNLLTGVTGSASRTYSYNAKGEATGDGSRTFGLNALGQITSVAGASYVYDGNAKRIKVTLANGTVEYALYDLSGALLYTDRTTPAAAFGPRTASPSSVPITVPTSKTITDLLEQAVQTVTDAANTATAAVAPATPTNPMPGDPNPPGPTTADKTVTLSWSSVATADSYTVQVLDGGGSSVFTTSTSGTSATAALGYSGSYHWSVSACNAVGCSVPTASRYFQTPAAPAPVETTTDYIQIGGKTIAEISITNGAESVAYLHPNLLGSPMLGTDTSGTVAWHEHYDPYGQKLNGVAEKIGYTGHAFDAESGFTYMQARFYDPQVGRFLSTDPVHFSDKSPFTFNRYSYANNNPYRFTDPTGMVGCDGTGSHIGGSGAQPCSASQGAGASLPGPEQAQRHSTPSAGSANGGTASPTTASSNSAQTMPPDGAISVTVPAGRIGFIPMVVNASFRAEDDLSHGSLFIGYGPGTPTSNASLRVSETIGFNMGDTSGFAMRGSFSTGPMLGLPIGGTASALMSFEHRGSLSVNAGPAIVGGQPSGSLTFGYNFKW